MKKEIKGAPQRRVGAVLGVLLSAALTACGGGDDSHPLASAGNSSTPISQGGEDTATPVSQGGGSATPTPTVPTPSVPGSASRVWAAAKTLPSGVSPLSEPALDATGAVTMVTRTMPSGTVANGTWQTGNTWQVRASLENAAPGVVPFATASRGDLFVATVIQVVTNPTVTWTLQAAATGPGQAAGLSSISGTSASSQTMPQINIDADGGVTVFWVARDSASNATLLSRRRPANGTWGPVATITSASVVPTLSVLRRPDGSATLVYGRASTDVNVKHEVWAMPVDSHGAFGSQTRLDNPSQGNVNAYMIRGGVSSAGTLVLWPVAVSGGGDCLASRTLINGAWRTQSCVNGTSQLEGVNSFGTAARVGGLEGAWWTTGTNQLRMASMTDAGTWQSESLPSQQLPTTSSAQMVGCASGAGAMVWRRADGAVYGARRNAQGTWSSQVELVASATGRTTMFQQVRSDDACNFTFAWTTGSNGAYDVVTRAWKAGATSLETAVVHATGVRMGGSPAIVGLAVEPAGVAVLVWWDDRDALTRWRRYE